MKIPVTICAGLDRPQRLGERVQWAGDVHLQLPADREIDHLTRCGDPKGSESHHQWSDCDLVITVLDSEIRANYSWIMCSLVNGLNPSFSWLFVPRF